MKHFKSANTKKYLADVESLGLRRSPLLAKDFGFPPDTGYEMYKVKLDVETPEEKERRLYKQFLTAKKERAERIKNKQNNPQQKPQRIKLVYGKKYEGLDYNY